MTMQMELTSTFIVERSLERVWLIMALEFENIGLWASAISFSRRDDTTTGAPGGAPVGGRVCTAPGFGDVKETITLFDEKEKRFSYRAEASGMPDFVTGMENNWSFRALTPHRTEVTTRGVITLKAFPGALVAPFMRLRLKAVAKRFAQELKTYAETGQVATSKAEAQVRAGRAAAT
jgi:hypothetical protein